MSIRKKIPKYSALTDPFIEEYINLESDIKNELKASFYLFGDIYFVPVNIKKDDEINYIYQ